VTSEHERINAAAAAAGRGWLALAALETARRSEDVDRARHGAQHELETILRVLGFTLPELPRGATTRGRRADVTIVDDELPFEEPTPQQRNQVAEWWNQQRDTRPGKQPGCGGCPGGRRFGCTC